MKNFGKALSYFLLLLALLCPLILSAQLLQRMYKPLGFPPKQQAYRHLSHYKHGAFQNLVETSTLTLSESLPVLKQYLSRPADKAPARHYRFSEQGSPTSDTTQLALNWLGHATVLIKSGKSYILTDPVLLGRASPISFMGPKRLFPSPIAAEALPELEAVLISHDHYDHLSYKTLKAIAHKVKHFFVPLGVGASLRHWGIPDEKIIEMDWWQVHEDATLKITATPARHFSGRFLASNNTLWASWAIEFGGHKIYFGGDSGYFEGYEEIGRRLGPFDLALMPIGAYNEGWRDIHLFPDEAVKAHQQVGGGTFLPIHWGTFDLAPHSWYDPMQKLIVEAEKNKISLLTPTPGEWITPASQTNPHWWQEYRQPITK